MKYVLSIDAGTTSSRALLIDRQGEIVGIEQESITQHHPNQGWIEHDPEELWETQKSCISQLLSKTSVLLHEISAIGIANQRETTIVWEKATGKPIWNAIVWNDRRTTEMLAPIKAEHERLIRERTGLFVLSYFSASKIAWILNRVEGAFERAEKGELLFGTVNTWLLWKLTNGRHFTTDPVNACRTLLFNIHTMSWDPELLKIFNIPKAMLPEVKSNSEVYGMTDCDIIPYPIPIASMIGDQQAALFGQACFNKGDVKCTYGTGSFLLMNTGQDPINSKHNLLTTLAWKIGANPPEYAIEGLVYSAGSLVSWLIDYLGIIKTPKEIESLAFSVSDNGGIYFVPALNGLASPYWNESVRGTILGISDSTNLGHIARAALEGVAFQVTDVLEAMQKDATSPIRQIKCDGGMSEDLFLMQMQADLIGISLSISALKEMTAVGGAYLAGLAVGFWQNLDQIKALWRFDRKCTPSQSLSDIAKSKQYWKRAVKLALNWASGDPS